MKDIRVWNPSYMMIMKFEKRDYEINKTVYQCPHSDFANSTLTK